MLELALGGAAAGAGLLSLGIFHPRFPLFGPVVWHGPRDQKRVAVSFDDGPHPDFTPRVAEMLRAANAKATFFCVGKNLEAHPDVARALLAAGHELANHTFTHDTKRDLFSQARLQADIERCQKTLATFTAPPAMYRPAVGIKNPPVHAAAKALGLTVVTWSDAARDGAWEFSEATARKLAVRAQNGDILALHDGVIGEHQRPRREATLRHLPVLLSALRDRGFDLTSVSAVLGSAP
jgi:peptidoglycan/xylan/chitin deacetylase (PgdA/CDA1 family)